MRDAPDHMPLTTDLLPTDTVFVVNNHLMIANQELKLFKIVFTISAHLCGCESLFLISSFQMKTIDL